MEMNLMSKIHTFVDIKKGELDKLTLMVTFQNVEYEPSIKKPRANFLIQLIFDGRHHWYGTRAGSGIKFDGKAIVSETRTFSIKLGETKQSLESILNASDRDSRDEINQIKSEIKSILDSGAPQVSIDLSDTLARIMGKISRA